MHLHAPHAAALHQGSGELKTKPTQHSVKELRSIGIAPDILVCRSEGPIPAKEREKLALFCNVRPDAVIAAQDLASIYEAPLAYHREGLDQAVLDAFADQPRAPSPTCRWEDVADRINNPEGEVRVAIVGKYTQLEDAYKSIAEALTHGGMANRVKVIGGMDRRRDLRTRGPRARTSRISTPSSCPAASASAGRRARSRPRNSRATRKVPYLGICLGMQMAVIEAARNLADLGDAGSEEFDHEAGKKRFEPVVYHLKEWVQGNYKVTRKADDDKGGTMRLGAYDAVLSEGSRVAEVYGTTAIEERHRHRYEVDIKYRDALEEKGLVSRACHPTGACPRSSR
jgi:CTP synthase